MTEHTKLKVENERLVKINAELLAALKGMLAIGQDSAVWFDQQKRSAAREAIRKARERAA